MLRLKMDENGIQIKDESRLDRTEEEEKDDIKSEPEVFKTFWIEFRSNKMTRDFYLFTNYDIPIQILD